MSQQIIFAVASWESAPDCLYLLSYGSADSRHTVQAFFRRSLSNKEIFITLNKVIFN